MFIITSTNSCASDLELDQRLSPGFRASVYFNNAVTVFTFLSIHSAVKKMLNKNMFGRTTRNLLFFCMFYFVIHGVFFAFTLNWSFYRSITESKEPCRIMFSGEECFFLYLFGIFLRILLLFSQCAVTFERVVLTVLPNSDLVNSATLNLLVVLMSVITTSMVRPVGPSEYHSPICFQQFYPGFGTVRRLTYIMIAFIVICFPCNFLLMIRSRIKFRNFKGQHGYDLKSRYHQKTNMHSSIIVSITSFVQTLLYTVHLLGLLITLHVREFDDALLYFRNFTLWCYTFPLAGLALPSSILVSYVGLTIKKNNKIAVLKSTTMNYDQDAYFKDLVNSWNAKRN